MEPLEDTGSIRTIPKQPAGAYSVLRNYTFLALAVWTVLVILLLFLVLSFHKKELVTIARHEAEIAFRKDLTFRRWNAGHGGVYVPVSENSPPNPYLSAIPERDIATPSGRKLTMINPTYMIRQVNDLSRQEAGIWGHITSLNPLRPENGPDEWEAKALQAFGRGEKEVSSVETVAGKEHLRFMRPLITEESCLKCHAHQGYKKGDIRGGMSITLPLQDFWSAFSLSMRNNLAGYGLLWLAGIIAIVISSGKLREKTLRIIENEERYRILFNTANDAIFMTDPADGIVLDANKRAGELIGMPVETIKGVKLVELHSGEDKQRFAGILQKVVAQGEGFSAELSLKNREGRLIPVELSVSLGATGGRKIVQLLYKDLTESRKDEMEKVNLINRLQDLVTRVSSSQREWTETFDSITDVIFISDMACTIVRANRAIEIMLGQPIESVVHQKCYNLFQWMHPSPEGCAACACVTAGLPSVLDHYDPKLDRFFEVSVLRKLDSSNEAIGLIHIVRDITEQKKLEAQLVHAQKMEAVGQLAGGVAHDFNNVLTAIISCASLMNIKLGREDQLRRYVGHILTSSRRGSDLVKGLLAFSRKQAFYPALMDLDGLVRGVEGLLRTTITEEIELRFDTSDCGLPVMADKTSLEQVLINLVGNARDAISSGGTITLSTDRLGLNTEFARMYGPLKQGEYALLSVSDTGEGIPDDIKGRVFEPFFTTKDVGKGTGLGLSIIYGIVKQHEGHISLESMPGIGTTVKIYLPLAVAGDAEAEEGKSLLPVCGSETVLLAENNAVMREITVNLLEEFGYTVIPAADGEQALEMFNEGKDTIGLAVLDVIMPKMNGKQVHEAMKKIRPDIRAIFTSGYDADILWKRSLLDKGRPFILKPISPDRFLKKIREVLDV